MAKRNPKNKVNIKQGKLMNVKIVNRNNKTQKRNNKGRNISNVKFNSNRRNAKDVRRNINNSKKTLNKNSLKKQEEEIEEIENENELFCEDKYIGAEEIYEEEWEDNKQEKNLANLSEILLKQMNSVEEKKLDPRIVESYSILGEILTTYTSGKLPKAFNILPVTENWEEIIEITNPPTWSPQAMLEATKMFCSNLNGNLSEKFYSKILLPAIRTDIKKTKKLNIHYYNCLKKAIFKPSGFFKGIIIPLSDSTTSKEASIIGSIIKKCSIPVSHSSACIMKLLDKCNNKISMGALFFTKMLLLKKYALPTPVKEALVNFFYKYINFSSKLPVLWHQTLLIFTQIYKLDLTEDEKIKMKNLVHAQNHHLISEDIIRELNYKPPHINLFNGSTNSTTKQNNMMIEK